MPFYKRSFLYLIRKRTKSILLLLIFLLVNSMILSTNMILRATERTEADMQEKTKAKVVCEITDTANEITDKEAEKIENLANVTSVNRLGQQSAYLTDLSPVTASDSTEQDNLKVSLQSFDDMETDSPFEDQSYRLTDGGLITPETQYGAVVNAGFADANGLQLGDQLSFETESGKTVTLEVIGEYLAGNENRQEKSTLAVYRVENQIYIDNTAYCLYRAAGSFRRAGWENTGYFTGKSRCDYIGRLISADESPAYTDHKSRRAHADAYVYYGYSGYFLITLYVDADPPEGNGCFSQHGRTEIYYFSAGASGGSSSVSDCHGWGLWIRIVGG